MGLNDYSKYNSIDDKIGFLRNNVSTVGTGEDDLHSVQVPVWSMGLQAQWEIVAVGTKAGAANNKTIKLYFGATVIATIGPLNDTADWGIRAIVTGDTDTAQRIWVETYNNNALLLADYLTAAIDTSAAAWTIKTTGECVDGADSITERLFTIRQIGPADR